MKNQQLLENGINPFYMNLQEFIQIFQKYELSEQYFDYFQTLVTLAEENNIELNVFIQPAHALQWELINKAGLWSDFEQWKNKIVQITPVWDFSGFNSITTSPPDNYINYIDQSHYRKNIGNYVFDRMLHVNEENVPKDFGVYLTKDNIKEHLLQIRTDREKWENNNPEIIKRIRKM